MSGRALGLIAAMDRLYEAVVSDPSRWDDAELAAWAADLAAEYEDLPREWAREVRRVVRLARRLAAHWRASDRPPPGEWRSAVDAALGGRGWQPTLAVARLGLTADPDPEVFEEVRERFRVAHFTPWMEGVTFAEWQAVHGPGGAGAVSEGGG